MQALILAAGFGKRLRPLTDSIPKALVEVKGVPLLVNALENLSGRSISEVLIVVGDKKKMIIDSIGHEFRGMKITYIENPLFESTNNVYSFWLAGNYIHDDIIMLECDLFYNRNLIETILAGNAECNILVSLFDGETMDGTVIDADESDNARALIIKRDQTEHFDYSNKFKTVNVYTFKKDFILNNLMPAVNLYIRTQSVNSYYELVLGSLIYFGNQKIQIVKIDKNEWCEIDDLNDYKRAQILFPA